QKWVRMNGTPARAGPAGKPGSLKRFAEGRRLAVNGGGRREAQATPIDVGFSHTAALCQPGPVARAPAPSPRKPCRMPTILLLSLLLLAYLLLAGERLAWLKASLLSCLLLALSAWWLVDRLSGNGIDPATLYHLQAGMQGAGVTDFSGDIARLDRKSTRHSSHVKISYA